MITICEQSDPSPFSRTRAAGASPHPSSHRAGFRRDYRGYVVPAMPTPVVAQEPEPPPAEDEDDDDDPGEPI